MLTLEERIARIEAYLTRQNAAWNATIASNGASGSMTPAEDHGHEDDLYEWIVPKGTYANVRDEARLEANLIYQLPQNQSRLILGKKASLDMDGKTWYRVAEGYVREDVVTVSLDKPAPIAPVMTPAKWPIPFSGTSYSVTNRHGVNGHTGIDLATFDATPSIINRIPGAYVVKTASCNGCTSNPGVRVKSNNYGYGNFVIVSVPHPFKTGYLHCLYAHLSAIHTFQGVLLMAGDVIGSVGNVGDSTGNHLHIEMREADTPEARWATLQGREIDPSLIFEV